MTTTFEQSYERLQRLQAEGDGLQAGDLDGFRRLREHAQALASSQGVNPHVQATAERYAAAASLDLLKAGHGRADAVLRHLDAATAAAARSKSAQVRGEAHAACATMAGAHEELLGDLDGRLERWIDAVTTAAELAQQQRASGDRLLGKAMALRNASDRSDVQQEARRTLVAAMRHYLWAGDHRALQQARQMLQPTE